MTDPVRVDRHDRVAVVTIDNPPVNALGHGVRLALLHTVEALDADEDVDVIVLACAGATFSVGADVRELGAPPRPPSMGEVMARIDAVRPTLIAAIHGQALGGGLELALLCDYRVASADARLGMPEINLGLIPGGGGTQRLPRLIGVAQAIEMILSGKPMKAPDALACGLIDEVVDGDLGAAAIAFARQTASRPKRRLSRKSLTADAFDFAARRATAIDRSGLAVAGAAIDAVEAATRGDFAEGLAREAALFQTARTSSESAALRHLFTGERQVMRLTQGATAREIDTTAVVGAGTMGAGVTIALLDAGYRVTLVDTTQAALDRGVATVERTYANLVQRGRLEEAARQARLARLHTTLTLRDLAGAQLVIECVFEDMAVKQALFAELGPMLDSRAVLASNTSALDVNAIAAASGRAADVVGMHFFSPANIMRLVEVVDADATAPDVLATAIAVSKRMGKVGVVSRVCDGFIGNRMLRPYLRQANMLLLEGAFPEQVDGALRRFGMAMGPHAMGDMAGLDIQAAARERRRAEGVIAADDPFAAVADRLVAEGRLGLKSGKGMYRYLPESRAPLPDPEVVEIIHSEAARLGFRRRSFDDEEIVARCILPLINEGARILDERIARGAVDIDLVYCNGYGFPRARGGPMFYADTVGLPSILEQLDQFAATTSTPLEPTAPLLARLASQNGRFADLPRS